MPTIKDVARAAGVSVATVSYVLNDKRSAVSEETRQRVLSTVKALGYTRNINARNLRHSQTRLIGYGLQYTGNPRPNTVLEHFTVHLAREASFNGYHLVTFTYNAADPLPVYHDMVRTGRVDAFIIASTASDDERIAYFLAEGFPFVSFGRANPAWDFNWVDVDGRAGTQRATAHLIGLGHQRIGMAGWPTHSLTGNDRLAGYLDALHAAGLTPRPEYIVRAEYGEHVGELVLDQYERLPRADQPTGIVTVSDMTAISIMGEAERRGHTVGQTLSVIGFDDEVLSRYLRPSLTTLRQPIEAISAELITMVHDLLTRPAGETRQVLMPPELIVRESVSSPP